MKRVLCGFLAVIMLLCLTACGAVSKAERRIQKGARVSLDLSGCRIEQETDTHGGFLGDGEYLLVLDCSGNEEKILAHTGEWQVFPMSENLRELLYGWGIAERNGIPQVSSGKWYFYDRFSDATSFDRNSDERLLSRPAENFSLLLYDSENSRLYYFEMDT